MNLTVDLETSCAVTDCVGFGGSSKCKHALSPWTGKIDLIGVYGANISTTFTDVFDYISFLDELDQPVDCCYHNGAFDVKYLIVHSGVTNRFIDTWEDDTQLMIHVCTDKIPETWLAQYAAWRVEENKKLPVGVSHRPAGGNSLKTNAPYWLGVDPFWEDPSDHNNVEYCLTDCKYTDALRVFMSEKLHKLNQFEFYKTFMMPAAKLLLRAELQGIQLDHGKLQYMKVEYQIETNRLKKELDTVWAGAHTTYYEMQVRTTATKYIDMYHKAAAKAKDKDKCAARYDKLNRAAIEKIPKQINYGSPKQMLWLLKDYLKLPVTTFEGEESTGKAILQDLADKGHEDIKLFLEYRKANKILTSFLPKYKELVTEDGAIHPNFNLTGTKTGRLSSSNPNFQQVPPKLYSLFKPREGYTFLQHDQAAIEGKLIGLYSGDPEVLNNSAPGQSIHNSNAKAFFELECDSTEVPDKHPDERKAAKTVGFALFYGAGAGRIQHAFTSAGFPTEEKEAKKMLKSFRKTYKDAFQFHRDITEVFESGEIVQNLFDRPVKMQDVTKAYMNGFNSLIQGSASDLVLASAVRAQNEYDRLGMDATVILLVHDFIMVEAKKDIAEEADKILTDCMINWNLGKIQLEVDGGIGDVWNK